MENSLNSAIVEYAELFGIELIIDKNMNYGNELPAYMDEYVKLLLNSDL